MKFLIATHNEKKKAELQRILKPLGITICTADDLNLDLTEVEETGTTFEENAYLKAKSGCDESGLPCIADDSGLEVDALNGEPGVYSARYAGEHGNDALNIQKLLENMKNVPDEKRTARFVCSVCCCFPDGEKIIFRGTCEGKIGYEPVGENGFGYDPVFYVGDKTFAQMTAEEKDPLSHRGKALNMLCEGLKKRG